MSYLSLMNLVKRALYKKINHEKIEYSNDIKTKDIFLSSIVLIEFEIGYDRFYCTVSNKTNIKTEKIINKYELLKIIEDIDKIMCININNIITGKFTTEIKIIEKYIQERM